MPAEALETAQFRHGPLELAGPNLAAIVIATEPETESTGQVARRELREAGAAVLVITRAADTAASRHRRDSDRCASLRPSRWSRSSSSPGGSRSPAAVNPGLYVHAAKVTTRE